MIETTMKAPLTLIATLLLTPLAAICYSAEPSQPANASSEKTKSFLFIGNSFTMRHSLPSIFAALAQEGFPKSPMNTEILGYGGKNLSQHWELFRSYNRLNLSGRSESDLKKEIDVLNQIAEKKGGQHIANHRRWLSKKASASAHEFDYVVLQSWQDITDDPSTGYFKYAAKFSDAAKAAGAQSVLYLTAPYAQNETPVSEAVEKQKAVGECRAALAFAKTTGAIVVPMPLAINLAQASTEPIARTLTFCYKNDLHPNQTMAYLTACTLYAAVFNKSPEGLFFNKVTETKSQNIHSEAVKDGEKTDALSSKVSPDGGPLEKVFTDEERLFLQRTAWEAVEAFRKGEF